ncbi:MFS transporter [Peptococcaceae bacterium 1198_IL3148]
MSVQQPLWTKNFIFICLTSLFLFTSFYFLIPTLPVYVTDVLHGNDSQVGYIVGVLTIAAVIVRPIAGYLLDTIGRKKVVLLALAVFVIATFAYSFTTSLLLLLALRAIHGFSWGFCSTGTGTLASDIVPATRRGEGMGYFGLAGTFAMALGPIISLYILDQYGFNTLFLVGAILAAMGLLFLLGTNYEETLAKDYKENTKKKLTLNSILEPRVYSLSVVMFFVNLAYGGIMTFITIYAKELNISNAGLFFLIYGVALLFVRPYAGKHFDKHGPNKIMFIGFVALATAFTMLFAAKGYLLFILSAITMGVGFGIIQPTIQAMAINRVEPFRRGAVNGTIFTALDLGIGVGSIMLGLVSNKIGLSYMYLTCGLIIVIPMAIFFLKDAKRPNTQLS